MDDLLSMDWGKQPQQPQRPTQSSTKTNAAPAPKGTSSYAFDALTRQLGGSASASKPRSANATPSVGTTPPQGASSSTSSQDAFSSLFNSSSTNTKEQQTTMSLAQRQKIAAASSFPGTTGSSGATTAGSTSSAKDSVWGTGDDWDLLGATTAPGARAPAKADGLSSARPPPGSPAKQRSIPSQTQGRPAPDPFDFSEFEDPGQSQSSALGGNEEPAGVADDDDLSIFGAAAPTAKPTTGLRSQPRGASSNGVADRSGDLGLGEGRNGAQREGIAGLLDADEEGADDLLGGLGQPVARQSRSPNGRGRETLRTSASQTSRATDPPPHILGRLVEMGFSPLAAKQALCATVSEDGKWNVEAAAEQLLGGQDSQADGQTDLQDQDRRLAERLQRGEHRNVRSARRPEPTSRAATPGSRRDDDAAPPDWQKQADALYAQASEIGASVLTRAGALWSTAKAQAQKALDERVSDGRGSAKGSSGRSSPAAVGGDGAAGRARPGRWAVPSREGKKREEWSGKPKWMIDAEAAGELGDSGESPTTPYADSSAPSSATPARAGFKDSDDEEDVTAPKTKVASNGDARLRQALHPADAVGGPALRGSATGAAAAPAASSGYVSPARRAPTPRASRSATPTATAATKKDSPVEKLRRQLPEEAQAAVGRSQQAKEQGNHHFKQGAYGEAETAYTRAMEPLHAASLLRVPLLTNRASARMKNGDASGALRDCEVALRLILGEEATKANGAGGRASGPSAIYRPEAEAALPGMYRGVNLREAFAKALSRKAQASEMCEKWEAARFEWSRLETYEKQVGSGSGGVALLKTAREGMTRCDKAMRPADVAGGAAAAMGASDVAAMSGARAPAARQSAAARAAIDKAAEEGVARFRAEQRAANREADERMELKDSVDARIVAWKGGKETNVRALLASVDTVVWPGLGWTKVGMHQLVTDAQVKKAYTRAIAKLHPDKLTPAKTTLEERMIGTAVFSALNEAWAAKG